MDRKRWLTGCFFGIALLLAGCGSRTGSATGTVRCGSQVLTGGTVSFYCDNGEIVSSLISAEGTYHLPHVAPGAVRVAVVSHAHVPPGLQYAQAPTAFVPPISPKGTAPDKPVTLIPERYNRPESSGVNFVVQPGEQILDLELLPQ